MRRYQSLRGRREFGLVQRRGRAASTDGLVVFAFTPRDVSAKKAKIGIVVTKKVGNAVMRNRLRRRCKAILDQSTVHQTGKWYVVQCRPSAAQIPYANLREQLIRALKDDDMGRAVRRREARA